MLWSWVHPQVIPPQMGRRLLMAVGTLLLGLGPHPSITPAPAPAAPSITTTAVVPKASVPSPIPLVKSPAHKPVGQVYHIRWGDSLWSIGQQFHVSVEELEEANDLTDATIYAGHYLVIPQLYTVQAHDTVNRIASKFQVPLVQLWHDNRLISDMLKPGQSLVIPYTGVIPANNAYAAPPKIEVKSARFLPTEHLGGSFSPDQISLLAHLVQAEAGNQPFVGQVAVAAVVLNRLKSPEFPQTLEQVILQPGQFESVSNGTYRLAPSPNARMAVEAALNGWDPTDGALYFYNPALTHESWIEHQPVIVQIGEQRFSR